MVDLQDLPILCFCDGCGRELYPGNAVIVSADGWRCAACAGRLRQARQKDRLPEKGGGAH